MMYIFCNIKTSRIKYRMGSMKSFRNRFISIRKAAKIFNILKQHLNILAVKAKASQATSFIYNQNSGNNKSFISDLETSLANYLKASPNMCHGLTSNYVKDSKLVNRLCLKRKIPTLPSPPLIVLDNHQSNRMINVVLYVRENNIMMQTCSPHCNQRIEGNHLQSSIKSYDE